MELENRCIYIYIYSSDIQSAVLTLCLKLPCRGRQCAVSSPSLCEETEHWPLNKFPSNVQTSKSTCPRCFVCLLPLSGPHPLTPDLSFSSETNVSTRRWDTLCLRSSHLWQGQRAETRGKLSHVQKWVWILAPHILQQPVLLNVPSKSVTQPEKNPAATTCSGFSPKQTLPPVCTPRQMTIGLKAWLAQRSPIQYLFSQFKALAAAHLVSAVQSNAPLIATLRLCSPQKSYTLTCASY